MPVWVPSCRLPELCPPLLAGLRNVLAAGSVRLTKRPGHRALPTDSSWAQGCPEQDPGAVGGFRGCRLGSAHHNAREPLLGPQRAEGALPPAGSPPSASPTYPCWADLVSDPADRRGGRFGLPGAAVSPTQLPTAHSDPWGSSPPLSNSQELQHFPNSSNLHHPACVERGLGAFPSHSKLPKPLTECPGTWGCWGTPGSPGECGWVDRV